MNLSMTGALAAAYHSGAQRARVVTEAWARSQLYCANCDSSSLGETPANRAIDFVCPRCRAPFQLKAKHSALGETVTDGAYTAMVAAIREDRTPNLLLMRYALATWEVRDLLLIPSFMFLIQLQRGAHAPRVRFDAPPRRMYFPNVRDEASRTTREGACAPHHQAPAALIHGLQGRVGGLQHRLEPGPRRCPDSNC